LHSRPVLVAILGPTATGKSRLAIELARRFAGEIVNCDSTAVYRRLDIGTDKVTGTERQGIPHHLIDIVEPTAQYSAAEFARAAAVVVRAITARGRMPMLVGGTGFYYRAVVRGLFDGPAADRALRDRLEAVARRHGDEFLHRMVARFDPDSARRIQPRDRKRLVRALEVRLLTGRPLTAHFAETRSPLPEYDVVSVALKIPTALTAERVAARVDRQFAAGIVEEVRGLLADGVPRDAHAFSGLVYRQVMEMLDGVRGESETRALIVRENRNYARRQLIWFRKEPNLNWLDGPGERPDVIDATAAVLRARGVLR
jgi:tRNA dimethylallyltransferase